MRVIVAGGSGFLGGALRRSLRQDGHEVVVLTRSAAPSAPGQVAWVPDGSVGRWAETIDGADAVVNLAGENIAGRRWTAARKEILLTSRLLATRSLVAACLRASRPPRVFVSGSGADYYPPGADEMVTEATPPGQNFLARVCIEWEQAAEQASPVTRVALVRTGLVLHPSGGALAKMLLPFKLGVGGPQGPGTQFMSWIHRDDWVGLVRWLIANDAARGAFNGTAPEPVPNREFARALGQALGRPAVLPTPTIALRVLLGEMSELLVTGRRVVPARALEMGFRFRFARVEDAFADLLPGRSAH